MATRIRITEKMLTLPTADFFPRESLAAKHAPRLNIHQFEPVQLQNVLSKEEMNELREHGIVEMELEEFETRFIQAINKYLRR